MDSDRGPLDIDDLPNNEGTELSSMLSNPVKSEEQKKIIKDVILQQYKIRLRERGQIPMSD